MMGNQRTIKSVELKNISKSFGGITALKDVTLKALSGEIHALMGENGAGKSTLMKILSGACPMDNGKILIDGKEVVIRNTHDSKQQGIGIIYQEFSLVPELSVAENVFLNQLNKNGSWLKWSKMKREASALIEGIGFSINPSVKVCNLSIAQQQIVEIAKALSENVKVLILDEPSAVLGLAEVQKLFDTLQKLKSEGVAIIYISHHLSEIFQIADRVTVLKDGISSESLLVAQTDKASIINMMLGRSLNAMFPIRDHSIGAEILKVDSFCSPEKVNNVSFVVHQGEVLGIAGLVGSGRTETVRAIFGADKKTSGSVYIAHQKTSIKSPRDAVRQGMGMVPEDRKQHGVILSMSIKDNINLTNLKAVANRFGFIHQGKENAVADEMIQKLKIKTSGNGAQTGKLSGGNQQKVALAKWLNRDGNIMIIDEPTRGVDVGAKVEIYNIINELSGRGVASIIISSETAELMGICDRILVMREGQIQGLLEKEDFSEEVILRLSIGASH